MAIDFTIFAEDGSVSLSLDTKPIGTEYEPINMTTDQKNNSGGYQDWTFIDPETKIKSSKNCWVTSKPVVEDGKCTAYRLVDGIAIAFNEVTLNAPSRLGYHDPNKSLVGIQAMIDMTSYKPQKVDGDFLEVFDEGGELIWSISSLAKSVQLVSKKEFEIKPTDTYANATYSMDIPENVDLTKLFVCPIMNGLPYVGQGGAGGIFSARYIIAKLVGRKIYFTITWHVWFNTMVENSCDNVNNKIKDTAQMSRFSVALFYLPSAS